MRNTPQRIATRLLLICLVLLGLVAGCGGDKKGESAGAGSGKAAASAGSQAQAPVKPLAEIDVPADVLLFGGADNLQQLVTDFQKLATDVAPMAAVPIMLPALLQQGFKLSSPDALDLSRPARFVFVDPKKFDKPIAIVLATKGKDKLVAALPADKKANDQGNAYSWKGQGEDLAFLNFVDDFAVISPNKDLFASHKDFIAQLIKAKLPSPVALMGSVKNAVQLYGPELTAGIQAVKAQMQKGAEMQAKGGAPGGSPVSPAQLAGVMAMMDWFDATAKELDSIVMMGSLPADGASLSFYLHPKKGSELEKTFQVLGKRPLDLLAKLPPDTAAFFAMNIDPDSTNELMKKLVAWSLTIGLGGQGQEAVAPKYLDAMTAYWKATTGEMVFAAHKDVSGKGMSLTGLMGMRDAAKAHESMKVLAEMYKEKALVDTYKQMGMTLEYKEEAYKVGDVSVSTMQIKAGKALAALGPFGPMLEDLMTTHTAHGKDLGVVAYGKDGKATIEAFLGGKIPGGLDQAPGVVRALKNAAPGTFLLTYVAPIDLVKGMDLGGKNPLAAQLGDVPASQTGIGLSVGAQGGVVTVTLDLPAEQAKAIAKLAMLRGAEPPKSEPAVEVPGVPPALPAPKKAPKK